MYRFLVGVAGFLGALFFAATNYAAENYAPTARELLQLPEYCQVKLRAPGISEATKSKWKRHFGDDWEHMHHYCKGLNFAERANGFLADRVKRGFLLHEAVGNFKYSLKAMRPGWVLAAKAYVEYGKVLERLKDHALEHPTLQYQKAIMLQPDYTRAYAALSDYYLRNGMTAEAREVLDAGLKHAPGSRSLKRRVAALEK